MRGLWGLICITHQLWHIIGARAHVGAQIRMFRKMTRTMTLLAATCMTGGGGKLGDSLQHRTVTSSTTHHHQSHHKSQLHHHTQPESPHTTTRVTSRTTTTHPTTESSQELPTTASSKFAPSHRRQEKHYSQDADSRQNSSNAGPSSQSVSNPPALLFRTDLKFWLWTRWVLIGCDSHVDENFWSLDYNSY